MKNIFFIGINGIGMSGLAKIMKYKGYSIKGTDISTNYVTQELKKMGITIYNEHKGTNLKGFDTVIASTAISKDNPEYKYALDNGLKIIKRGELLASLLNKEIGIAVSGTHGKTTTSSMMACAMLTLDPTVAIGGILPEIKSNARAGASSYFIAEADESDNSFLYMLPKYSIITNIERDHLEIHENLENIKNSFKKFIEQTEEEVLVSIDCENVRNIIGKKDKKITTYSLRDENANIYAKNIKIVDKRVIFEVVANGTNYGEFILSIPGEHNISNSLPVIYLAIKFGVEIEDLKKALYNFKGSKRRFDILYENNKDDIRIIDDYAHHPTEIKATLKGLKSINNSEVVAIFQPHRYSRLKLLLEEFKDAFVDADKVLLLPVYSAGEKNIYNIEIEDLKDMIDSKKKDIVYNFEDMKTYIKREMSNKDAKTIIFMGAGDISKLAHEIADDQNNEG